MSVFRRWLEGEADYPLLDGWREAPPKTKKPAPKKRDDRKELRGFLRVYAVCAVILCAVLILCLLVGVMRLPAFAAPGNPTDNEVGRRYVSSAEA